MTRKDFELIADTIRTMPETIRLRVAVDFATALSGTSPRFDHGRFMHACGIAVKRRWVHGGSRDDMAEAHAEGWPRLTPRDGTAAF